jgi:hypothetical protein
VTAVADLKAPRPLPDRRIAVVLSGLVVLLALPLFLLTGWDIRGWTVAAVLWVAGQILGVVLSRFRIGGEHALTSGVAAFVMMFRGIVMGVVLVVLAATEPEIALAAAIVYALAYTLELGLSLTLYFSHPGKEA